MSGSQCSYRPGNRTPPSLSPGLHTLAQCWGGGSPFQISTNTLHQTVMCECEWGEEGRVSGPTGPMMVTSGFPVPWGTDHSLWQFYSFMASVMMKATLTINCDVCVVRRDSELLDQWWRRQVSPGLLRFIPLSICLLLCCECLVKPWINSLVLKASLPF